VQRISRRHRKSHPSLASGEHTVGVDDVTEWPDAVELERWQRALDEIAERIRRERGVSEVASLSSHHATLWVNFGDLRVRVAGGTAEVSDEAELFAVVDFWVAFERRGVPGPLLDRDLEVIAAWKARLPGALALWQQAAALVFADVEATTDIRWTWHVTLHEDDEDWSAIQRGVVHEQGLHQLSVAEFPPGWTPPRRTLLLPELWLEADRDATSLSVEDDLNEAIGFAASCVQDWVMDDIQRAWPTCPRHQHPAELGNLRAAPTWVCPLDDQLIADVGKLGGAA
jgi:hypothetical protein